MILWGAIPILDGSFKGEKIDHEQFTALIKRYYDISGFDSNGLPSTPWQQQLSKVLTGFGLTVTLPELSEVTQRQIVIDRPVVTIGELRTEVKRRFPHAAEFLDDHSLGFAINGKMLVASEENTTLKNGDKVDLVPHLAGG
ncbi:MAG: MoaD/ThiS family protein [Sedimenticola sp.]